MTVAAVTQYIPQSQEWMILGTAKSVHFVLGFMPVHSSLHGDHLRVAGLSIRIVPECTPLVAMILLSTAMLAYPARIIARVVGIVIGTTVLWLLNVARLVALTYLLNWNRTAFTIVHVYIWWSLTVAVLIGMFGLWLVLQRKLRASI